MTNKIFFGAMAVAGLAFGGLLVAVPASRDFFIKPYFWMLIAVGAFDLVLAATGRAPQQTLTMLDRAIGFIAGAVLMAGITIATGTQVTWF